MNAKKINVEAFLAGIFTKMKDFSSFQAVAYSVKVVLSKKLDNIDMVLLHTTNRKYHNNGSIRIIFNDLESLNELKGHSPLARSFKLQFDEHLCDISMVLTDTARYAVSRRQLSFLCMRVLMGDVRFGR